ncbi:MAG: hypothetical protein ACFFC7_03025 [Candidatus Hermodarchaeota archaeon]
MEKKELIGIGIFTGMMGIFSLISLTGISNLQQTNNSGVSQGTLVTATSFKAVFMGTIMGILVSASLFAAIIIFVAIVKIRTEKEVLISGIRSMLHEKEEQALVLFQNGSYAESADMFEDITKTLLEAKRKLGKEFNLFDRSLEQAQKRLVDSKVRLAINSIKTDLEKAKFALMSENAENAFVHLNKAAMKCKDAWEKAEQWNLRSKAIQCGHLKDQIEYLFLESFDRCN